MDVQTINKLNQLNQNCYRKAGLEFDQSRQTFWPGWSNLLPFLGTVPDEANAIDVGCGNARFAQFLSKNTQNHWNYWGLDSNQHLLTQAKKRVATLPAVPHLIEVDLISAWQQGTPIQSMPEIPVHLVTVFGLIHHIPSFELRQKALSWCANLLPPGGLLVISAWQFLNSPKLVTKQITPSSLGFDPTKLEPNDTFLPLGNSDAVRFCHQVTQEEMVALTAKLPLTLKSSFSADGHTNDLNLYWVWEKTRGSF